MASRPDTVADVLIWAKGCGASLNFQSDWLELIASRRKIGPNFNPEVGFIERADCICDYLDPTFKLRPKLRGFTRDSVRRFCFSCAGYKTCVADSGVADYVPCRIQ